MSRHDGDPVPHEHQFYRTTLKGLYSLDLNACGTFSYKNRSGYRNLDDVRQKMAQEAGLILDEQNKTYRLPLEERANRISALFKGMALLEGGAKQALHYTDVSPVVTLQAVTRGGNNLFGHVIIANSKGQPQIHLDALREALKVHKDDLLSEVYVGWVTGYLDDERAKLDAFADSEEGRQYRLQISHPREAFQCLAEDLKKPENASWLE
jgi:CRISPR-associated protein Cst2